MRGPTLGVLGESGSQGDHAACVTPSYTVLRTVSITAAVGYCLGKETLVAYSSSVDESSRNRAAHAIENYVSHPGKMHPYDESVELVDLLIEAVLDVLRDRLS